MFCYIAREALTQHRCGSVSCRLPYNPPGSNLFAALSQPPTRTALRGINPWLLPAIRRTQLSIAAHRVATSSFTAGDRDRALPRAEAIASTSGRVSGGETPSSAPEPLPGDAPTSYSAQGAVHYAVVGAGLAGVATAWHLLRRSPRGRPIKLDLYDAAGVAAGGSGAAAGLLHAYNPRGKLLWRGQEAMAAALDLVAAAAAAAEATPPPAAAGPSPPTLLQGLEEPPSCIDSEELGEAGTGAREAQTRGMGRRFSRRFVWPTGLVRPAANSKQAVDFAKAAAAATAAAAAAAAATASSGAVAHSGVSATGHVDGGVGPLGMRVLNAAELQALVPGLARPRLSGGAAALAAEAALAGANTASAAAQAAAHGTQREASGAGAGWRSGGGGGGGVPGGTSRRARRAAKAAVTAAAAVVAAAATPGGGASAGDVAGLLILQGVVLDVGAYLRALWRACQVEAEARGDGSCARLRLQRVAALEGMCWEVAAEAEVAAAAGAAPAGPCGPQGEPLYGKYDAIVVAAGAAAATIEEVQQAQLPLQLCHGLALVMRPPPSPPPGHTQRPPSSSDPPAPSAPADAATQLPAASPPHPEVSSQSMAPQSGSETWCCYPPGSPSLLGQPYLAAQGPTRLVVGATKSYGWTAEAALEACGRSEYATVPHGISAGVTSYRTAAGMSAERQVAEVAAKVEREAEVEALREAACVVWEPLAHWRVEAVREGVRALPPRTTHGSLPLLGRLMPGRPWWLVAGLGSRGLVYHGWLGRLIADAVLSDTEDGIPAELKSWRGVQASAAVFEAP